MKEYKVGIIGFGTVGAGGTVVTGGAVVGTDTCGETTRPVCRYSRKDRMSSREKNAVKG